MRRGMIFVVVAAVILALVLFSRHTKKDSLVEQASATEAVDQLSNDFTAMVKSADAIAKDGELLQAQDAYREIISTYITRSDIGSVQKKLEDLNMKVILSAIEVPDKTVVYEVKKGDMLGLIANKYHTTVAFIKKQNGLSSDVIRPGMRLRIWSGRFSVVVDKSQNILTLQSDGEVVKVYHVSTGRENITPVGTFKVINKLSNPPWTHDGKVIPASSPQNILGTRWLGFDVPGYGIHGTTQPESIGQQATAGCVRMLNSDVEELYDLLPLGTEIIIMD